jgi:hypothetical protein
VSDLISDVIAWVTTDRAAVVIAALALIGIFYSARSARAAKEQASFSKVAADAAREQAGLAYDQVELGRQQTELLLQQVDQARESDAATRRAQRESLQPMVTVQIRPAVNDPSVMVLNVANIGPSLARNVRISVTPPITRSFDDPSEDPMYQWKIFTDGVRTMPPGYSMEFLFDIGFRRFTGTLPLSFTFVVSADGPFGPARKLVYEIDLRPMRDMWVGQKTLGSIVDTLDKTNESLGRVAEAVRLLDPDVRRSRREAYEAVSSKLSTKDEASGEKATPV